MTKANTPATNTNADAAAAAAAKGAAGAQGAGDAPKTDAPTDSAVKIDDPVDGDLVWVVSVNAPMLNLHTNVWYNKDPKKVELDPFVRGQVAAGKLELVQP